MNHTHTRTDAGCGAETLQKHTMDKVRISGRTYRGRLAREQQNLMSAENGALWGDKTDSPATSERQWGEYKGMGQIG